MNWYKQSQLVKITQTQKISLQEAVDRKMFGPVYHGTTTELRSKIEEEGFRVFEGETGQGPISHGYEAQPYGYSGESSLPPIHHLGYGIYLTTSKGIAKDFSGGTTRGMKTYYLDVPNLEIINWGSPKTMMKWWIENGYKPHLAKVDRVMATRIMTQNLASQFDAIWYKGKGLYRLLDGDQICVYDISKIYEIDKTRTQPGDTGSKVRRKEDGMIGQIVEIRYLDTKKLLEDYPLASSWVKPETTKIMVVKWRKGGTEANVQDVDVEFL